MTSMFTVDGENISGLVVKILAAANKYGIVSLVRDLLQILGAV